MNVRREAIVAKLAELAGKGGSMKMSEMMLESGSDISVDPKNEKFRSPATIPGKPDQE